jgi:drug/metabolite transporter (DMT)-like permease
MPFDILLLVLFSSLLHAGWNYLAKTIPGGPVFVWLMACCATVLMTPVIVGWYWFYDFDCSWLRILALLLTGILHFVYFIVLQRGYELADLSVVYPLARGSGPVFTTLGAWLFLRENIEMHSLLGLLLIIIGVLLIAGIGQSSKDPDKLRLGVYFGIVTGLLIGTYTVFDGYAVLHLAISPILVEYFSHPMRVVFLGPMAHRRWQDVKKVWGANYWKIIFVSAVSPFAFIIVLYAMRHAPVHIVAPAREMSIVFGVLLGARFLTEENFRIRLAGALLIVAGVFIL